MVTLFRKSEVINPGQREFDVDKKVLYNIVWGKRSKLMKNKLNMSKYFEKFETDGDAMNLLKEIRQITLQIQTNKSVYNALDEAK